MYKLFILLFGAVTLPLSLFARENDSTTVLMKKELSDVVVTGRRPALKHEPDKIIYIVRNDPFAKGLDCVELLDNIPQVSVINNLVSVAGKNSVKYIIDGHLLEMTDEATMMKLKNLQADGINKIELLTTPPARYAAGDNVAYINIVTRNESLGTRGNVWNQGSLSDNFNYSLGGNISNTTRKIEISGDASWNDSKGNNDIHRQYIFTDNNRTSDRATSFTLQTLGANGMFKYKFDSRLSTGAIVNFSSSHMGTSVSDFTADNVSEMLSTSITPSYPDNSLTLTGFVDWNLDSNGKLMSLTYNYFDKNSTSISNVTTALNDIDITQLNKDADNNYNIHSVKLDAILPFSFIKLETGIAFTKISNKTKLIISDELNGIWQINPNQSNNFIYSEKTGAVYLSAGKNFGNSLFGKIALRYEHTNVSGLQKSDNSIHNQNYRYLFPSINVSHNFRRAGRLSADYSIGIIRPNFSDMNPFRYYTTVNDYFTGNPDLKSVTVHNIGVNYSFNGLYAVLYGSWNKNAIGYITRFNPDRIEWTMPENCLNTMKSGIYSSYNRFLFDLWNINIGGEVYYSASTSKNIEYRQSNSGSWSGKIELNTSWLLNRQKTLIFNIRTSHYFPYQEKMINYSSRTLLNCELRYMLLDNKLTLSASLSDPFEWNITTSNTQFKDYYMKSRVDIHSHSIAFRIAYSFGRDKVNCVYRDTKEHESQRSN